MYKQSALYIRNYLSGLNIFFMVNLKSKPQIVCALWLPTIFWLCSRDSQLHQNKQNQLQTECLRLLCSRVCPWPSEPKSLCVCKYVSGEVKSDEWGLTFFFFTVTSKGDTISEKMGEKNKKFLLLWGEQLWKKRETVLSPSVSSDSGQSNTALAFVCIELDQMSKKVSKCNLVSLAERNALNQHTRCSQPSQLSTFLVVPEVSDTHACVDCDQRILHRLC